MPYKISGAYSKTVRVIILQESDWSVEENSIVSGTGNYEFLDLVNSKKTIIARATDGEVLSYGNVDPAYYSEAPAGEWKTFYTSTYWESHQGSLSEPWQSNGWEVVLSTLGTWSHDYFTKCRITFTGASPLLVTIRDYTGAIEYGRDEAYVSGAEIVLSTEDWFGRLYAEGGSFEITNIEFYDES